MVGETEELEKLVTPEREQEIRATWLGGLYPCECDSAFRDVLAELDAIRAQLRKYGSHQDDCAWIDEQPCTCGFAALLSSADPQSRP